MKFGTDLLGLLLAYPMDNVCMNKKKVGEAAADYLFECMHACRILTAVTVKDYKTTAMHMQCICNALTLR